MSLSYKPLGDRVLLENLPKKEKTEGGIFIPTTVKVQLIEAKVIAVGELITTVKAGDKVFYDADSGEPVTIENKEYVRTRYAALEAII